MVDDKGPEIEQTTEQIDIVCAFGDIRLKAVDLACLADKQWISSKIVDAALVTASEELRNPNVYVMQSVVWQMLHPNSKVISNY